jgi:hypothetical protein
MISNSQIIINELLTFCKNTPSALPSKILLIAGQDSYSNPKKYGQVSLSSKQYTMFGDYIGFTEIAFLTHNTKTPDSLVLIMGLFFGSIDDASKFIHMLKANGKNFYDFAKFLYYEKGIMLVNRNQLDSSTQKKLYPKVIGILDVGRRDSKNTVEAISKMTKIKYGYVVHCSTIQQYDKKRFDAWYRFDDNAIEQSKFSNPKISFKDFII